MKACGKNLILQVEPVEQKIGFLIVPEEVVKKNMKGRDGIVESIGASDEIEVCQGDGITYIRGKEIEIDETHVVIPQSAILYSSF
jgi:hypothetical protein